MARFSPLTVRIFRWALGLGALGLLAALGSNLWVLWRASGKIYVDAAEVPARDIGLVLGTSPTTRQRRNLFFEGRMDAAAQLYKAGKVRQLLLSGDNSRRQYDEPTAMKAALVLRGVPEKALHLDYAGFRTLDSVARARDVFGVGEVVIITDDFHLPRSLLLARAYGLDPIGFSSKPLSWAVSKKTRIRETASRTVAVFEAYLFRHDPKFSGPKVDLGLAARS